MKIQFIGCGSAFTSMEYYQSNVLVTAPSGKKLLIDCGGDARFALGELGITSNDIDAVYVSHLHKDHIGGMEWLAFTTYFNPGKERPLLYTVSGLMQPLWTALKGGLESLQGKMAHLTDYFDCKPVTINTFFEWE